MKKPKKISKLKIPRLPKPNLSLELLPLRRTKSPEEKVSDALSNVPRITNETVIDHREEALSSARKYIYPLQHSKHLLARCTDALITNERVIACREEVLSSARKFIYPLQHSKHLVVRNSLWLLGL